MAAFKDFFDEAYVARLADALAEHLDDGFSIAATDGLTSLELKDRVARIADTLHGHLKGDWQAKVDAMVGVLAPPQPWQDGVADMEGDAWRGFSVWPLVSVVERHGLAEPSASYAAMHAFTQRFSAEFAVRPYLIARQDEAYEMLSRWVDDPSEHVRRLVSEGSRPRLPWGQQLKAAMADPSAGLALLERLVDDPSLYVRRSVANHLNDISKDHPDVAVTTAERWMKGATADRAWVVKHALRGLVKAGHPGALAVLGFRADVDVEVRDLQCAATVSIGEKLPISMTLRARADAAPLIVDYAVHYQKASGAMRPKVFKWASFTLAPGAERKLEKRHAFKPVTTRKLYVGAHAIEVLVNGVSRGRVGFELVD